MNFIRLFLIISCLFQTYYAFQINFKLFENLLSQEKDVIISMKNYIKNEERKLKLQKNFVFNYEENVPKDKSTILANPLLTYQAIKRFKVQWNHLLNSFDSEMALINNVFIEKLMKYNVTLEEGMDVP